MGRAGLQFRALLWKNGLCRLRHPVLSLAEFLWPCILFMILMVLRFQTPPRHKDSCFLQPRDLPSRGVFPFVRGLLCNTGSTCRNASFEEYKDRHFRFQTAADDRAVNSLGFLEEMQDLAEDIYETASKAKHLQRLWGERVQAPDSSGSSFLTMNLNHTEEVLEELEILQQQPHLWAFLLSPPRLGTNRVRLGDAAQAVEHLLRAALNSVASLDNLDWLPRNTELSQVSEIMLNATISALAFLQQPGGWATESTYHLSLQSVVWDPWKVQNDLRSQFGFDDLQAERILNYSVELQEFPTERDLERMVSSALSSTLEEEAERGGHRGGQQPKRPEARSYLVGAVSQLRLYRQVLDQWHLRDLLQKVLIGTGRSLQALRDKHKEGGLAWKVAGALHAGLHLLSDVLAVDGPGDSPSSPQLFQHLQKLWSVLQSPPRWPALEGLLRLDGALRNVIAQDLDLVREILAQLESSADDSVLGGPDGWKLEKDAFFWGLRQILTSGAARTCRNVSLSEEGPTSPRKSSIWVDPWALLCHHSSFNKSRVLNRLLGTVESAAHVLQEAVAGNPDILVSDPEAYLGWQEIEKQLVEVSHSCSRLFQLLEVDASLGDGASAGGCEHELTSTMIFHIIKKAQLSLRQMSYWKSFLEFIRKTCEMARYVNIQGSFQNSLSALSEDSPCDAENMGWKIISDVYFDFLNNILTSPVTSTFRAFNFTKYLLGMEKKWHAGENEETHFLLSFVELLEELLSPDPSESSSAHEFHSISSLLDQFLNRSVLWVNHFKSLGTNSSRVDAQKLLEFGKMVIEKIQTHGGHWMRKVYENALGVLELTLSELNPKVPELWLFGILEGAAAELETATLLNFSVPENETILSKNLSFSQLFRPDGPESPAVSMHFVHISRSIIHSLFQFGYLTPGEVSEALDTMHAISNASDLFSAISDLQKQEIDRILTHIYLHVFKDKDSALLLQICSSFYQYLYKLLSLPNGEPLLTYLSQISRRVLDIAKQFNFQDIRRAFAFLSEAAGVLGKISEESYCQQLLSIFNFLELQAQSLTSTGDPELEGIHATLTVIKRLLVADEGFRISLFQYVSQLVNGSGDELMVGSECFSLENQTNSSSNHSTAKRPSLLLPWAQIYSTLSANVNVLNEFMAIHCTVSWLQMWAEIWESLSHIFNFDLNVFASFRVGLTQILDELENDVQIAKSCRGLLPNRRMARLILNLFENVSHADGLHIGHAFLELRDVWVPLGDALVAVRSLNLDQVERSLSTMETALHQLKSFPLDSSTSRQFLYALLDVFIELSNVSEYLGGHAELTNHFLSINLTDYRAKFESVISELRETVLFLRHVSPDGDLSSCADVFQKVTELILKDGLLHANTSQRLVHILAMFNSTFFSENFKSHLGGCLAWVDAINHLYSRYNSNFSQGLVSSIVGSFPDLGSKINSTLKIVTWILDKRKPLCSLNEPNINCVNTYLQDITDCLNTILTTVFEKEKEPKFEIVLALLNDSTDHVRMIVKNLTREFGSAPQSNWKHFNGLIFRPVEVSDEIPSQFRNIWLHLIALGKEAQKLVQDISPNILGNISSKAEKILSLFGTTLKEKDLDSLGRSFYHLASYLTFNLSGGLQNASEIAPNEIRTSVELGIQLARDVLNSLMPMVQHDIPVGTGHGQALKRVSSFMRSLRRTDVDLLVGPLEQISESLVEFFKNVSRSGADDRGVRLLVGLMEKIVDSSHSWHVSHLLRLSRLFPRAVVKAVVDVYNVLPHVVRLLERVADKNLTEGLQDVHDFVLLHGIGIASVSKEDFAMVIETLSDTIEQILHQPTLVSEALTCFPVLWCRTHAPPGFLQNPELEGCDVQVLMSSSFYGKVASMLDHLHLPRPGQDSQCSNKSLHLEMTRKAVCAIHDLADWNSILLELSGVFHIKTSLLETVQELWHKVLPFVPPSGNESNGSIPELCPGGPLKQVALKIIENLTNVNFTRFTYAKNILDKLASLNKILNIAEGTETAVQNNISVNLERISKSITGAWNLENRIHSLLPPSVNLLNASRIGSSLQALAHFLKPSEVTYNTEELWLDFMEFVGVLIQDKNVRHLLSEIAKEIQSVSLVALQNTTLQFSDILELLNASSLTMLNIIEDFLPVTESWLRDYAKEDSSRWMRALFVPVSNESSTGNRAALMEAISTFWDYLKNISRESNFSVAFLSPLLHLEQLTNFSLVQGLLENTRLSAVSSIGGSSQEPSDSAADFHMMKLINLTLNHPWPGDAGKTLLSPRHMVDFVDQLLKTFFSLLLKEDAEHKISLLLRDLDEASAEMSSVPRDHILEALKLDQFLTSRNKDTWRRIFSSLREAVYHLIRSSFTKDRGTSYSDNLGGLQPVQDLVRALLREASVENNPEGGQYPPAALSQALFRVNGSVDLVLLHQSLSSVLHFVRESSAGMANLVSALLTSPEGFRTSCPVLQEVLLANLTDLLFFTNNSFPLRNREALEITQMLLGVISDAGADSRVLEPLVELSRTLATLLDDSARLKELATTVDSFVELLQLAKRVSGKIAMISKTHFVSSTKDSKKFLNTLYFTMKRRVLQLMKGMATWKKDHFVFESINDVLVPFLDLVFGMNGVKPKFLQDSGISSLPLSSLAEVTQSKDFTEILEEMAQFLTSVKIDLGDLGHLMVVFSNRTQIFPVDSVNSWEDILGCLVPINYVTSQIGFLHSNPASIHSGPQDARWERIHEMIHALDKVLTGNSTKMGTYVKMLAGLTLDTLWGGLKRSVQDVFSLLPPSALSPCGLSEAITAGMKASHRLRSGNGEDLRKGLFSNMSSTQSITCQLEKAIEELLARTGLSSLLPNDSQWVSSGSILFQPVSETFINGTSGKNVTSAQEEKTTGERMAFPQSLKPASSFKKYLTRLIASMERWQTVLLEDSSVMDMCRVFQQLEEPSDAAAKLQRAEVVALRVLIVLAESPSLVKGILCAALSCERGGARHLIFSAIQGAVLGHSLYQETEKIWSSPRQLQCESLRRNLSSILEGFRKDLASATEQDCLCQAPLRGVQQAVRGLVKSLGETWMSRNPVVTFLRNFTVTGGVKVKEVMRNITRVAEELRSFVHISEEAIHGILEANVSHSEVLPSMLTVALSGKCDQELLRLLLAFPEAEQSGSAATELCALPGSKVLTLVVVLSRNLDLRAFVYKALIPSEARGLLGALLDVVSSLSSILSKAQRVLRHLPGFLQALKIDALLERMDFAQASPRDQARSSAFDSFQSVMSMMCQDEASFLSSSNTFLNLPSVDQLLEDNKEKFNIPQDSTPFCLKLYEEILQSPNGALVWSFLKPILHGQILYAPDVPAINEVIQKANYTFYFVDKLKTLSETLLKMSSLFQGSASGQMFSQLQEALRNKFIRSFVESQLRVDAGSLLGDLRRYGGMLDKVFNHTGAGHFRFLGSALVNLSSCVLLDRFRAVESEDVLESEAHKLMRQNEFLASVIFNSSSVGKSFRSASRGLLPHVTYTLRTSILYSMRTDLIKNPSWKFHPQSLPADGFKYNYIFVPLQDMIERAIAEVQTGQEVLEPTTQAQAAPYPCHTSDLFLNNVGFFFPLIMMLTWMVSVASMVRRLVYEREIQIEEYLRMTGVHPAVNFLAWFVENVAMLALSSATVAVILKTSGIFAYSDVLILFLFLLDFGVSAVMLSYFLSAFFSQANTAALCTSLLYLISFLPYILLLVLHSQLGPAMQTFLCLLSTTAFGQGVFFITFLEGQEAGIQWNNIYQPPEAGSMTFGWVCWMILLDSSLYFLCGWYLSNLIPGAFGLRKPWYFPLTAAYWKSLCGLVEKRWRSRGPSLFFLNEDLSHKGSSQQDRGGEPDRRGTLGAALVSVTKKYEGHQVAVQDFTLTFPRGQITAFLGTNGAGKTTIMSMLTGLYPPTSGTIYINGKNLQTELSSARAELGVCPQQDVLLDKLTVREHLRLFAAIKAPQWTKQERQQQVNKTLEDVGLMQHQHKQIGALSGGMKRRLSIAIAFLGQSRTVVLDEPTSGVDPCSRRSLWDILLKYREGRTIILTTHHLDEAELLSDRVAILQQGRLRCCGPPFCLKETYGQELSLTLAKQPSVRGAHSPKDTACLTALIHAYIPQAVFRGSSGRQLTYTIPQGTDEACFKGLFQALDQNLQPLHLVGYGISAPTLEEVFLMLLEDCNKKACTAPGIKLEPQSWRPSGPPPDSCGSTVGTAPGRTPPVLARGHQLLLVQMAALLRKRLLRTCRAWKSTACDLLLPVLFVALAMGLFMVQPLATEYPALQMTPGHYESAEAYFFSSGADDLDLTPVLLRKFRDQDPPRADPAPDLMNSSCWRRDPFSPPDFQDSCGCLRCPNRSTGAPYLTNRLGHTLFNFSEFPVEQDFLVPSSKPSLGGWSFGVRVPSEEQDRNTNASKPRTLAKVWYNQKSFHSLPSYLNHLNNLILWRHLPPGVDWRQYAITLYSRPYGGALLNEDKILESIRQCGVALCIVLGFSVLSASVGSNVVRDRVTGAKRLQHISGLGYRTYWVTHFLYDMLFYLVSVGLCVAVIVTFQLTAFTFRENLAATALLLALFGYATLPWMYLMSGVFSSSDVAFISYISLNFIFGLCTLLMTTMPRLLAIVSKAQNLQNIYDILKRVFMIFPQFCLGQGLIELCYNQIKYDLTQNFGVDSYVSPFEMQFLGWIFVELALQGTVLLLLRILLHGDLLRWSGGPSATQDTSKPAVDPDVEKEQRRVLEGRTGGDILVLHKLSKSYRSFCGRTTAVQDISLGIPRGECFGLLGVNGAGKSTTFKMLNGDISPSSGHAFLRTSTGATVGLTSASQVGLVIGYCPQQDALDELLTAWEHLHYYCSLRGLPREHIPEVAADLVRRLHLEAHADKRVATYSGGTKRKLSTALALVGKPDILLLDEPSSGMDPRSKRYLWQTILQEVRGGCAAVLTSHSMEECEALCTRLAIIVDGRFQCLGSPQHIKDRFGAGYTVKVWLCKGENQPGPISDCLKLHFPGIQFKGQRLNLLEYHVPKRWGCLADLFRVLENNKTSLHVGHYAISETTLEQVFISFASTEQQKTLPSTVELPMEGSRLCQLPV
ncbi:ATP-binding cassette sub-family A member 13 [Octodon degus]|uniref:ATP-binding cassette sub-family A member 13 n=1 Tax=Octodon degus TaxID=10160 RepID=A0A6P6EDY4_OCTDE|nr:ATP-binding cassette sub-family A member 13 [Octodon degus]